MHGDKTLAALSMDVLATDLANYLVLKGVSISLESTHGCAADGLQIPFRETHHISGRAVALAEARGCQLNQLSLADYKQLSDKFGDDMQSIFDFEASVERRESIGGTSLKMVERQIAVLRERLA